jgi:predicted permease
MSPNESRELAERDIDGSALPAEIKERLRAIVGRTEGHDLDLVDVTRELIAHFEDGLRAGSSPSELLDSFGDEDLLARLLIGRASERPEAPPINPASPGNARRIMFLGQNLRYAWRRLRQNPGFTATAVLSLGLGIGANTTLFSLVNAVLLRESPLRAPEELVEIYVDNPDFSYNIFSYPDFRDLRDATGEVFAEVGTTRLMLVHADRDGRVEMLGSEAVSGNFFPMLGVPALMGRTLLPEDDVAPGAHPVTVLDFRFWRSAFGGDPGIVGREIRLGGRAYDIVGVAPESYRGGFRGIVPALYVPAMMIDELNPGSSSDLEARGNHSFFVKARLSAGTTLADAGRVLESFAAHQRERDLENWDPRNGFRLVPTSEVVLYPPLDRFIRAGAWLLSIVVGLILLLACTNLASFLLARAIDRRKEIAIRLALGATRRRLLEQLMTETLLLSVLGGAAGVLVGTGLLEILLSADLPLPLPVTLDLRLDARVLGFSLLLTLVAGAALGIAPSLQSSNPSLAPTLRDESTTPGGRRPWRSLLVVAQVAVSVVLLVVASLFVRSFARLQSVDPGFGDRPASVLKFFLPSTRYTEDQGRAVLRDLKDRFESLPGVDAVGFIDNLFLNTLNTQTMSVNVDGIAPPPDRQAHSVDWALADPGLFDALGVGILQGRNFEPQDRLETWPVAIISHAMAERFFPGQDPLGRLLRRSGDPDLLIVGVVSDVKVRSLGETPRPFVYRPLSQVYTSYLTAVARTSGAAEKTALELMAAAREVDPDLWIWEAMSLEKHVGIQLLPARLAALLLSAFGALALALACLGLYGLVSYAVARRTREVGIRLSLGANRRKVLSLLMGGGLRLVMIGGAIGLLASAAAAQLLGGLLFDVAPMDPVTFGAVPLVLGGAAVLATYIPARRACRVDPVRALRTE